MKVFFDANVILDWMLMRQPTFAESYAALRETIRLGHESFISSSSINDIHYVIRKALKDEPLSRAKTESMLTLFYVAKVDEAVISNAVKLKGKDFEDDIIAATAIACGADCIVTNNARDFASYAGAIAVYSPKGYLDYLKTN